MIKISYIAIGTELLKGYIVNTNASDLGLMLREAGYKLDRVVTISDSREEILAAVNREMAAHDVVLISGGLGPTKDDITKKVLAEWSGNEEMIWHEPTIEHLKRIFAKRKRDLTERNRLQALVPAACEVLPNKMGTAPAMLFRQGKKMLVSMPGVPFELKHILEKEVIPRIHQSLDTHHFEHDFLRIYGVPESDAADRVAKIEDQLSPRLDIAWLPRFDGLWLELSVRGEKEEAELLADELNRSKALLYQLFEKEFYAFGDVSLEALVHQAFKKKGLTLAIAESLTGGNLAAKIVSISGASDFFKGSVTAYHTSIKIDVLGVDAETVAEHTVVSAEVAQQMAEGVRKLMKADVGLSTTGFAQRGSNGEKPQAWIGYSDAQQNLRQRVWLYNSRSVSIERACYAALHITLHQVLSM